MRPSENTEKLMRELIDCIFETMDKFELTPQDGVCVAGTVMSACLEAIYEDSPAAFERIKKVAVDLINTSRDKFESSEGKIIN